MEPYEPVMVWPQPEHWWLNPSPLAQCLTVSARYNRGGTGSNLAAQSWGKYKRLVLGVGPNPEGIASTYGAVNPLHAIKETVIIFFLL